MQFLEDSHKRLEVSVGENAKQAKMILVDDGFYD